MVVAQGSPGTALSMVDLAGVTEGSRVARMSARCEGPPRIAPCDVDGQGRRRSRGPSRRGQGAQPDQPCSKTQHSRSFRHHGACELNARAQSPPENSFLGPASTWPRRSESFLLGSGLRSDIAEWATRKSDETPRHVQDRTAGLRRDQTHVVTARWQGEAGVTDRHREADRIHYKSPGRPSLLEQGRR